MKRPEVEEFKRLCGIETPYWGMSDLDTVELCDYILYLEKVIAVHERGMAELKKPFANI
jgi:hypothetical protein